MKLLPLRSASFLLGFAAAFGVPRWILGMAISGRQKKFIGQFADAIDVIVRGVKSGLPLGECLRMIAREGLDGLSIGFVARDWSPRVTRGRELKEVELREISLVAAPMLPGARFAAVGEPFKIRVNKAS